jgi:hypothetical protein
VNEFEQAKSGEEIRACADAILNDYDGVVLYQNATFFSVAKSHLHVLPGAAKKATGIGSAAYEPSGGSLTVINFIVGKSSSTSTCARTSHENRLVAFNALSMSAASKL